MKTQKRKNRKSGLELDDILDLDDEMYDEDEDEDDFPPLMDKKPLYAIAAAGVVILTALIVVFVLHIRNAERERENAIVLINPAQTAEETAAGKDAGQETDAETAKQEADGQAQGTASDAQAAQTEVSVGALDDEQDPQNSGTAGNEESGAEVTVTKREDETADTTLGIDVSKYQGTINWAKVKASGVDFAMIRVGYRAKSTGEIFEDPTARYNMQEAQAAGVMIGAYFFSSAVTEEEAREEAAFTKDIIA